MDDLTGKVALVTGGSRGIGRDIALALAAAGCDVALSYRTEADAAHEVVDRIEALGRRAVALVADLARPEDASSLVSTAEDRLGPIGIVVNNAGITHIQALDQIELDDWEEVIRVNLTSAFLVTQAALPGLRERRWGRILMLGSIAAQTGGVIGPHYAASKAGLVGLMHSYAGLLAREGITANVVAPALIETDMIKGNPKIRPDLLPVGRFGQPAEVTDVVVMLARNGYVTGQTINVNGGWYMS